MPEFVTLVYLSFTFVALYFFSFFIILTLKNRKELFSYPEPKKNYTISVLIPAYNEQDSIEDTINHIMASNYPKENLEMIAINDGSTDNTLKILKSLEKRYTNLKLINKKNSGKADSLNQGIELAKGELIAVVDSDSFPSPDSLRKLTGYFNDPKMGAVTSFVSARNQEKNFLAKIQSAEYLILGWSRKLLDFIDSVYVTNGPLSLYRKSFAEKVGGFDIKTVTEDIDITWNMLYHGYKTGMCLDARVTTVVPHRFKIWFAQRTRWGVGGLQAIAKYRKMMFRKGMFGMFVVPYVSFSIIMSIVAFTFSLYLILQFILTRFLATGYSIATDSTVFRFQEINLYPSVIFFFMVVLFTLSLSYYWYVQTKTNQYSASSIRKFFNTLFYILVYLAIYPIVWFSSIYKFIRKDYGWYTK
jgi:cellulose synthase/poly-beta-1,6-N-acetylglucosamine synthase-like glycosyltransferase